MYDCSPACVVAARHSDQRSASEMKAHPV